MRSIFSLIIVSFVAMFGVDDSSARGIINDNIACGADPDGAICTPMQNCCSGYCDTTGFYNLIGVCAHLPQTTTPAAAPCTVQRDGGACQFPSQCCSGYCKPLFDDFNEINLSHCSQRPPCRPIGSDCLTGYECCSGHCSAHTDDYLVFGLGNCTTPTSFVDFIESIV